MLFLWNRNFLQETDVGEIVVYEVKGKNIPVRYSCFNRRFVRADLPSDCAPCHPKVRLWVWRPSSPAALVVALLILLVVIDRKRSYSQRETTMRVRTRIWASTSRPKLTGHQEPIKNCMPRARTSSYEAILSVQSSHTFPSSDTSPFSSLSTRG